jgi:ribosome maturation factor RimP
MGARRPFFMMATSPHDKEKQLYREVSHTVSTAVPGVEVLALELTGREGLRVYVDHTEGVDHALCERVSEALRPYLDLYSVEVSSPGFDRPLRTREHFERAVGKQVKLKVGKRRLRGEVVSAGARSFQLEHGAAEPADIPYEDIVRANLIDEGWQS